MEGTSSQENIYRLISCCCCYCCCFCQSWVIKCLRSPSRANVACKLPRDVEGWRWAFFICCFFFLTFFFPFFTKQGSFKIWNIIILFLIMHRGNHYSGPWRGKRNISAGSNPHVYRNAWALSHHYMEFNSCWQTWVQRRMLARQHNKDKQICAAQQRLSGRNTKIHHILSKQQTF